MVGDEEINDRPEEEPGFDPEIEWRFLEGDEVICSDGEAIGIVVGFHPEDPEDGMPDYLVVEHGGIFGSNNLYVPFNAVDRYEVDQIMLRYSSDDVHNQGWDVAPAGIDEDV